MSLSSEAQALFDHAKQSLPRWLTAGKNAVLEWLYGFTDVFDAARTQGQAWLDVTFLDTAAGTDLDQHALDRGTVRRYGESDDTLRARLKQITDAVTEPALKANIDAVLAANSLDPSAWVCLRRDRAHCQAVGSSTAFFSRGYRIAVSTAPMGYIVILPYGTTADMGEAVSEYLRQYGPAGYIYYVEIRGVP